MRRAAALLLPLLLLSGATAGCKPDRTAQLRQEIKKLEAERVPKKAVEKAKKDADAAEATAAQRGQELEEARAKLAKLQAEGKRTAQAFDREVTRNRDLRQQIDGANQKIVAATKKHQELTRKIAQEKERAGYLRDQAATLAQQLRPGDPAWANARRVENLAQVLKDAEKAYPRDPVLARLARTDLGSSQQPNVARAVATAEGLRDRLRWVYGLDTANVATGPPGHAPQKAHP